MKGLTGQIRFDQSGIRNDFVLDIVELQRTGLEKVGSWHDLHGIRYIEELKWYQLIDTFSTNFSFNRQSSQLSLDPRDTIENKTIVVTTIKSPPYAMFKQSPEKLMGNDAFEVCNEQAARSCKRSDTLFQKSLLLFSTCREYFYSQPKK